MKKLPLPLEKAGLEVKQKELCYRNLANDWKEKEKGLYTNMANLYKEFHSILNIFFSHFENEDITLEECKTRIFDIFQGTTNKNNIEYNNDTQEKLDKLVVSGKIIMTRLKNYEKDEIELNKYTLKVKNSKNLGPFFKEFQEHSQSQINKIEKLKNNISNLKNDVSDNENNLWLL